MTRRRLAPVLLSALMLLSSGHALCQAGGQIEAPAASGGAARAEVEEARAAIVARARGYAEHVWTASPDNVLHGEAGDGAYVDTPDAAFRPDGWHADGRDNVGVPYKWGGFDSLASFDAGVAAGQPAGELTDGLDLDASNLSLGVDCSGFVARCWALPGKQSTRSLGRISFQLPEYAALLPGDLVNKFDAHAMLFVGFEDEGRALRVIEAALPKVRETVYPVARLEELGFLPYRYKPLDPQWLRLDEGLGRGLLPVALTAEGGKLAPGDDWRDADGDEDLLSDARPGDAVVWARTRAGSSVASTITRTLLSRTDELVLQGLTTQDGASLQTQEAHPLQAGLAARLLATSDEGQPADVLHLTRLVERDGDWLLPDGGRLPVRVVRARWSGQLTMRTHSIPLELAIDAVLSPELPLEGVLHLTRRTTWQIDGEAPTSIETLSLRSAVSGPGG